LEAFSLPRAASFVDLGDQCHLAGTSKSITVHFKG
jgi:hypothetical protein